MRMRLLKYYFCCKLRRCVHAIWCRRSMLCYREGGRRAVHECRGREDEVWYFF